MIDEGTVLSAVVMKVSDDLVTVAAITPSDMLIDIGGVQIYHLKISKQLINDRYS